MGSPSATAAAVRRVSRPGFSLPFRRRIVTVLLVSVALFAVYMLWFRHSSLVAVSEVEVNGVSHVEEEVTAALTAAGKEMTTLAADQAQLEQAVAAFPTVESVSVSSDFPHRLEVTVAERAPVATVGTGDGVAVAGDGTVLSGVETDSLKLPEIESRGAPADGRVEGDMLAQAQVLGSAPGPLRPVIRAAEVNGDYGIVVELRRGIELRFGDESDAAAKWSAATAILADPKLDQLTYVDLRLPGRPAVGGAPPDVAVEDDALGAPPTGLPESTPEIGAEVVDPAATPAPVDPEAAAVEPPPAPETATGTTPGEPSATGVAGGASPP